MSRRRESSRRSSRSTPRRLVRRAFAAPSFLSAAISLEGRPEEIVVVQSLHPDLDKNAIAAFRQWEFEPGRKDGNPVRVQVTIQMSFAWRP